MQRIKCSLSTKSTHSLGIGVRRGKQMHSDRHELALATPHQQHCERSDEITLRDVDSLISENGTDFGRNGVPVPTREGPQVARFLPALPQRRRYTHGKTVRRDARLLLMSHNRAVCGSRTDKGNY